MSLALKILAYYTLLIFAVLGFLALLVEKMWMPFNEYLKRRRITTQPPTNTSAHDQQRTEIVERKQDEHVEKATQQDQRRKEKEEEKRSWILEDKKRRLGISGGNRLGTFEGDNEREKKLTPLEAERRLREQQDREFEESLRQDQLKEQQLRRRKEAAVNKEKKRKERMDHLESTAPLPAANEPVCLIGIRLPNGERVERKFYNTAKVQNLMDFVLATSDLEDGQFQLVTSIPRKVYNKLEETLSQCGLAPKAVLIAEEIQLPVE